MRIWHSVGDAMAAPAITWHALTTEPASVDDMGNDAAQAKTKVR